MKRQIWRDRQRGGWRHKQMERQKNRETNRWRDGLIERRAD